MPPQRKPLASKAARKTAPSTMSLPRQPREPERNRTAPDFEDTIEVVVGQPASDTKRFTMHTSVVTGRSELLASFLRDDPDLPVVIQLETHDPGLFQEYVNCLHHGPQALQQGAEASVGKADANPDDNTSDEDQAVADLVLEKFIELYILAMELIDLKTANMIIGEIILASDSFGCIPTQGPVSLAYASTAKGDPLRTLLRDFWVNRPASTETDSECLRTAGFPAECVQDIAIELLDIAKLHFTDFDKVFKDLCSDDLCRYHNHNEMHPECVDTE